LEGRLDLAPRDGEAAGTGLDAAGRRQYLYHEDYRAAQAEAKFDKPVRFADPLPSFREAMAQHMRLEPTSPDWTCAVAVLLINLGWFRAATTSIRGRTRPSESPRYARATSRFGAAGSLSAFGPSTRSAFGRRSSIPSWPRRCASSW